MANVRFLHLLHQRVEHLTTLLLWLVLLIGLDNGLRAQTIHNDRITVRATGSAGAYTGFDVLVQNATVATVQLSSARVHLRAKQCFTETNATELEFTGLQSPAATGLRLNDSSILVRLQPHNPYPVIAFHLTIVGFDPTAWQAHVGRVPFHFLALYLPGAQAWHQGGWLNATPRADPFPLLEDRHAGTPEIAAYHYNRHWSYTPPLGANPLPVIGLWAPQTGRYVGLEFLTTRLADNSEKNIATAYCWQRPTPGRPDSGQFVTLVYPYGGLGYQQLVFPKPLASPKPSTCRLCSQATLLWSRHLPASKDPNRFVWSVLWPQIKDQLPSVPAVPDLAWIPGRLRLPDFAGPPTGGLIGGTEKQFQVPGSRLLYGWGWRNESPVPVFVHLGQTNRLRTLEREARELVRLAKHFRVGHDDCVYWEKPLTGQWTDTWGGKPVTTLHNANGFAAGRLFLGLYRDLGQTNYLPVIDGVFNWARHIAWTRNAFADVPSSPFAIGGTLSTAFCLDYYATFKDSPDPRHRTRARRALDLARSFTYRYMVMWPCDNNRDDNLNSSFLWEPNSGRDWTGAACANEVFWNLDTLAQTAVETGDPILRWALQGSLSHWHLLYQNVLKPRLGDYLASDMAEGYGLYAGNIYGVGKHSTYGFAGPLIMTEPVGHSLVRVLAGEKAALAFKNGAVPIRIVDYRYTPPGNLAFTVQAEDTPHFDLSLTVPYVNLSAKPVTIVRDGKRRALVPGIDFVRPPQALWSLYIRHIAPNDRIVVGSPDVTAPLLPTAPPRAESAFPAKSATAVAQPKMIGNYRIVPLPYDSKVNRSWHDPAGWAGLPRGRLWAYGVPFELAPLADPCVVTQAVHFARPIRFAYYVYLLYSAGPGPAPTLIYASKHKAVSSRLEALAWRAWPPLFKGKLLVARIRLNQTPSEPVSVTGLNPAGRRVWAMTTLPNRPALRRGSSASDVALARGAAEWSRERSEEAALTTLRHAVDAVPRGTVAILPPKPVGPAWSFIQRAGLAHRAVVLNNDQLVNPKIFNARRIKVALYLDGEDYVQTVHKPGDGAAAVERYLREGGTLVVLPSLPWPFFYATGPGYHRPEPLTERLGLPLFSAVEGAPTEALTVRVPGDQSLVNAGTNAFPFPPGDPRLRSINPRRVPAGATYAPIASVVGATGKRYGDAAGLIQLAGGGRILYIACNLTRDPSHGFAFLEGALQFLLHSVRPH